MRLLQDNGKLWWTACWREAMSALNILAVIPSRMRSTRLPAKPLADIQGRPLVQWVYEGTRSCTEVTTVVVATDHDEIAACVSDFGGLVEMTSPDHLSGTDRVAEVAARYPEADVVLNVQGDQPFVTPEMLSALIAPFREPDPPVMSTLAYAFDGDGTDEHTVKVVCDIRGDALYFSRAPIPFFREQTGVPVLHHLGLYAFSRSFLLEFPGFAPTPLETTESLEQLRVLEHGYKIRVCRTPRGVMEVNTAEDLDAARRVAAT